MVSLTFYGGAGEIGGNKILLKDKDAKIYLDFGESFDFGEEYFWEYLQPRSANGLEVYFEFGLIPEVGRLYSKKMLERTKLKYEKPDIDGVLISHGHSDHLGHLPFLDEKIPIYMGHGTLRITQIYAKLYPYFCNLGKHGKIVDFKSGGKFGIKHLEVEPIHVEHSIPGAYGFIIKTSRGNIVYTGDLRMHGPRADMTREFIAKAKEAKPYALLCEGTRVEAGHKGKGDGREGGNGGEERGGGDVGKGSRGKAGGDGGNGEEHNFTEAEVGERVSKIISKAEGIVFGYFSMSNIDRFMSFYRAAVENGRTLVVDTRLAYVLHNLEEKVEALPHMLGDENIRVYYRLAKSCTFSEMDYYPWEREFMGRKITYEEIRKNPGKYVMHLNFYRLMELVYIQPENAHFIYSSSEHFLEGEGNEEEKKRWEAWMGHFGIKFHKAHCSGHASRADLEEMIREINPEVLIPVHTSEPEEFRKIHKNVILPEKGGTIKL